MASQNPQSNNHVFKTFTSQLTSNEEQFEKIIVGFCHYFSCNNTIFGIQGLFH